MPHGKTFSLISKDEISKWPGIKKDVVDSIMTYIGNVFEKRDTPFFIYFNPDIETLSKQISVQPDELFQTLKFLCMYQPYMFKLHLYFHDEEESFFYKLVEEDLEILKEENIFHHPKHPQIVFEDPYSLLRHAFVVGE